MRKKVLQNIALFLLAFIFSAGLMFAFTELPRLADEAIQSAISTPHTDPAYDSMRIELFYNAYGIRWIGYGCLGIVALFIILGFTTRKTGWAVAGGAALFLPVFATFAHSMFYLAGLGLFNIILFPFLDISLSLVNLGEIVLLPYRLLMWFFSLFHWYARDFITYLFMGSGAFIFVLGVFAWLQARYDKMDVARHRIYKYSRHPQYLGWIIWSYGLMLYGPTLNEMKKSWGWNGTLPWMLSALILIGLCLLEEIRMKERANTEYEQYRNQTPFLLPLPRWIRAIIKFPMRLFLRKSHPGNRREVGLVIALYAVICMGLSLFWLDLTPDTINSAFKNKFYNQEQLDSLVTEIRKPQTRRYRSIRPFGEMLAMGKEAYPVLFELIKDRDPVVREFAIHAAYVYKINDAIPLLINALGDTVSRVAGAAVQGLGELEAEEAADTLLYFLEHTKEGISRNRLLATLSRLHCIKIIPYLEQQMQDSLWYRYTGALRSMVRMDIKIAKPYIYASLKDERPEVRRDAVNILLETLPQDAIPYLGTVTDDESWEVRFYAKQAIRLIEEKHKEQK